MLPAIATPGSGRPTCAILRHSQWEERASSCLGISKQHTRWPPKLERVTKQKFAVAH